MMGNGMGMMGNGMMGMGNNMGRVGMGMGGCGPQMMPMMMGGGGCGGGNRNPGGKPGDWLCPNPDCLNHTNHVFAKHVACPKCGSEKPAEAGMRSSPY
mmetsp:Transcript_23325/g.66876  ORF Transcript_23325/g.66876 Transcript_23325/m.66876 type:complete len:98 (+) Transcript_23325:3-296(+)